jgi:hypothetical protein
MIQQQASLCHHKVPLMIVAAKNLHHILLISQWHNFVFIEVLKTSPYFVIVNSMNNDVSQLEQPSFVVFKGSTI